MKELINKIRNKFVNLSDKAKGSIFILSTGSGCLIIGILSPFTIMSLILGVLIILLGISYYKSKKGKKRTSIIFIGSIFLGVLLLGTFLFFFLEPSQSGTLEGETFTHEQEDLILNGQIYNFQHDLTNQYGEIQSEGELRIPRNSFITHYAITREGGLVYEIKFFTNVRMLDDKITLKVLVGDNTKPSVADDFINKEYNLTTSSSLYDFELEVGTIYVDGGVNVEFYFFQFLGEIDSNQPTNISFISSIDLTPSYTDPDDQWGYSDRDIPSLQDVLDDQLSRDTFFMSFFILFFMSVFLIMWVTGQIENVKYPLTIMIMTAMLILFVEIIVSSEMPIIKEAIATLEFFEWIDDLLPKDWLDPIIILTLFFQAIGMVIAFFIWSFTIGNAIVFCIILWFMWNKVLGGFVDLSKDTVGG